MRVRLAMAFLVAFLVGVVGVGAAFGAPGDLDTTFSGDGKVVTDIGGSNDYGRGVAVDSAGRIVTAGFTWNSNNNDFAVVRYTAGGSLDTSFGTGGIVTTEINGTDFGNAVAVDSQDRIIVIGDAPSGGDKDFAVVRYTTAGALDATFGTNGKVTSQIGFDDDHGQAVAVDSQGRIIVAGAAYSGSDKDFAVVRYTAAGLLDASFGSGDGIVLTDFGSGHDYGYGVAVDLDDRIVVAGKADNGGDYDFGVARYTTAGVLDNTFDSDGMLMTDFGSNDDDGKAVAIDSAGRIVVAGYSQNGSDHEFAVARYTTDGALDTSFSGDGNLTTGIGSLNGRGYAVAVDSDGRIIVAGDAWNDTISDFAVVRYTSAGALDTSFGGDGIVTTDFGDDDYGHAMTVDSAGRIIVVGASLFGGTFSFAVARYVGASVSGSPAGVTGVSGDGQVALSWVAPSVTGSAYEVVTDYVVEYSSDGRVSWSVFADGTSTSTSVVVTGLSNGTNYVFRVSAVNSAGTGAVSVVSAAVVPAAAVVVPAGCTIVGTPEDDILVGTGGDDHICGLGGNDKIYGKAGNDTLDGGPGKDKLYGGKGNDTLDGGKGNDVLRGGKGRDKLYGRGGADVLKGGPGNDKIYGHNGKDKLYGGKGKDKLYGGKGKDKLYGGKARDLLVGGLKKDILNGGKGKDKAKKPGPDLLVSIEIVVP